MIRYLLNNKRNEVLHVALRFSFRLHDRADYIRGSIFAVSSDLVLYITDGAKVSAAQFHAIAHPTMMFHDYFETLTHVPQTEAWC